MPLDAEVYIWGRAKSTDDFTNAFFFQWNTTKNFGKFVWDIAEVHGPHCPNWCWDLLANRPGDMPFAFEFRHGENDLYIIMREAGTSLDALYVVSDKKTEPPEEAVPKAVEPDAKLAVTWGRIKESK